MDRNIASRPQQGASGTRLPSRTTPADHLTRAAAAAFFGLARATPPERVMTALYSDDTVSPLLLRAATSPASLSNENWAGVLANESVGAFFSTLPASAAARLIAGGLRAALGPEELIRLPHRPTVPVGLPWVGEGQPIPVRGFTLDAAALGPARKLAVIVALTRELTRLSAAQSIFETMLREEAALALDLALFNGDAGTDERPAGLLHGVTSIAGTAGGGLAAMTADLGALAGAVGEASGGDLAIITSPARAMRLRILAPMFPYPVWPSRALPAGHVMAIDPGAFASGFVGEPHIDVSYETVLHFEDDEPQHLGTLGDEPGETIASAPARSLYQSDLLALRLTSLVAYAMRAPGLVAVISGATW